MNYNLITILGPTATGKTRLAAQLAHRFNGEIISADSRQVYKKMDLGTGKDFSDYVVENSQIPYHIIDIAEPETEFNLYLFIEHFKKVFKKILSRDKVPFLTGGTGLYISSVLQNYQIKKADYKEDEIKRFSRLSFDELKSFNARNGSMAAQYKRFSLFHGSTGKKVVMQITKRMKMKNIGFGEKTFRMF